MVKPITVERQEFMTSLINLVNGSPLPAFVIIGVFESMLPALRDQANMQYNADLKHWESQKEGEEHGR